MDEVAIAPPPEKVAPVQNNTAIVVAYAVTIFSSAFLLFQVQPLISKFILPWFGGSPAVWTAAMLFFQVVLFGGYLYAHLSSSYLRPRGQLALHLVLLVVAAGLAIYTQISPSESLKPTSNEGKSPLVQILMVLGVTVGIPYFALSSTGPLLQKWFSDAFEGTSPYRLFALSNVGSLLALLSYPFFFEVYWDSREQAFMWSLGFAAFAVCCAFCAWATYRAREAHAATIAQSASRSAIHSETAPSALLRATWIALPALASIMFLAVTNEVCQNVATVPLLWIIPLSFYLISFIVAFDHPRWYSRPICAFAAIVLLVYTSNFSELAGSLGQRLTSLLGRSEGNEIVLDGWIMECGVYFTALLLVCLICHCELASLKPSPTYLTSYFLSMSLGGALGGVIVNLLAPNIFTTFFELPLVLLAATALAGWLLARWAAAWGRGGMAIAGVVTAAALCAIGYWQIIEELNVNPNARTVNIYRGRSFFGVVSVQNRKSSLGDYVRFKSGKIAHGMQYVDPERRKSPEVAYYGTRTGCGVAMEYKLKQSEPLHIGVVGLGAGTIAAYARPGDTMRFYEINPEVIKIAHEFFHYLEDSAAAPIDIVLGDARLELEQELKESDGKGNQYDVLVLDAFSGDAIPTHLLTTEAFQLYKQHLKPDGILVAHITNSYLDLYPVVRDLAKVHGFGMTRIYRPSEEETLVGRTYYALLTTDQRFLNQTPESLVEMPANFQKNRAIPLWTDRYHNLFQVLR